MNKGLLIAVLLVACAPALGQPAAPAGRPGAESAGPSVVSNADRQRSGQLVAEAALLLDDPSGGWGALQQAETKLREALGINPNEPGAYVELARLRMKSSGQLDPDTLKAAEAMLRRALAIDPGFGNAYVLLGYVLTHARRFDEAEAAFAQAGRTGATSPWLESNMAELKDARGQTSVAAEIFTRISSTPSKPLPLRLAALAWLQKFHTYVTKRLDQAELAYQSEIELTPDRPYPRGNFACFLRVFQLDLQRSEIYARQALAIMDYGNARHCLGLTLYLQWAEARAAGNAQRADAIFREASRLEPDLSSIVSEVGRYPRAHPILEVLAAKGISLDTMPGIQGGTTPLSLAATNPDIEIAVRMMRLGANPNTPGYAGVTPLMIAGMGGNEAMVRLLLNNGADPTSVAEDGRDAERKATEAGHLPIAGMLAAAKRTYVRPAGGLTQSVPFRTRSVYRVKKDFTNDQSSNFRRGEQVVFESPTPFGNNAWSRFVFRGPDGSVREFIVEKSKIGEWSEIFEEVGPTPALR